MDESSRIPTSAQTAVSVIQMSCVMYPEEDILTSSFRIV
jgi:hypothetical protein